MTLGEKIKNARKKAGVTQYALAGDKITRNMLSAIENGNATPSFDTLKYLAEQLKLPLPYLMSEDDNLFIYEKNLHISEIRELLRNKNYKQCISAAEALGGCDDEIALILAECYTKQGRSMLFNGAHSSAKKAFQKAILYSKNTIYDTKLYEASIPMYLAICENVQAPLLEFDCDVYDKSAKENTDYDFFKYVSLDYSYDYKNQAYKQHLEAKKLLKERNYNNALSLMLDLVENKKYGEYNSYFMYSIYVDIESCYRQLFDFENAYRYSSKRISLMEGFKF